VCIYGIVTIENDIADLEIDKYNKRNLPLAKNEVTKQTLRITELILLVGLVFVVSLLGLAAGVLAFIYLILGHTYSNKPFSLKDRGWIGAILLGVCYGFLPLILATYLTETVEFSNILLLAASSLLVAIASVLLKDFKDEKGDKKYHKNTVLVTYGPNYIKKSYTILLTAGYLLLVLSYANINKYISVVILLNLAILLYCIVRLNIEDVKSRIIVGNLARLVFYGYALVAMFYM
jgi:homogentisate phytyltransferase/homogentisate geranylgeranyltransferase